MTFSLTALRIEVFLNHLGLEKLLLVSYMRILYRHVRESKILLSNIS